MKARANPPRTQSVKQDRIGLVRLVGVILVPELAAGMIGARNSGPPGKTAPPPAPPPMVVRPIAPDQAVKLNAAIPVASGPNPTAAPSAVASPVAPSVAMPGPNPGTASNAGMGATQPVSPCPLRIVNC